MTHDYFQLLCSKIISAVGEEAFKSEAYIDAFFKTKNSMYDAHVETTGGYIAGEVKMAVTLCLLAGCDTLDIAVIFDVSPGHLGIIIYYVLIDWVKQPNLGGINMNKYLNDVHDMASISSGFSKRSDGVLKGAIGAIDGWLVPIHRPTWFLDHIFSPITF